MNTKYWLLWPEKKATTPRSCRAKPERVLQPWILLSRQPLARDQTNSHNIKRTKGKTIFLYFHAQTVQQVSTFPLLSTTGRRQIKGTRMPKVKPEAPPPKPEMDNSGKKPICVPGFGWDLDFEFPYDSDGHERFAHGANDWKLEHRLTVREVSMLGLMNALTDKLNWNEKVFDEEIIEKWRQEALAMPFISEKAWEWCLAELRDKARKFEKTGYVSALDNGSGCIKSDRLVGEELRQELIDAVRPLQDVPAENRDWHPRSNDQVLNLVHPSLFPLVC